MLRKLFKEWWTMPFENAKTLQGHTSMMSFSAMGRTSSFVAGIMYSLTALTFTGSGWTSITCPKYCTFSCPNWHFFSFTVEPVSWSWLKIAHRCPRCSPASLGLVGYYRPQFVPIAAPLSDLTRKDNSQNVEWGVVQQTAFQHKDALIDTPVLSCEPNEALHTADLYIGEKSWGCSQPAGWIRGGAPCCICQSKATASRNELFDNRGVPSHCMGSEMVQHISVWSTVVRWRP